MRSGLPFTQLIEFTDGPPDGDISWGLLDGTGATVTTGTVTPAADAVSIVIEVSAANNTILDSSLSTPRELQWSYTVGGLVVAGRNRYRLDAFLPMGVSESGVRAKLGVELHELSDETIDLPAAYGRFQSIVGASNLATTTGFNATLARDAIEALAALALLPALQVSLASKESSGTNQFQRNKIDWQMLKAQLELNVQEGIAAVNTQVDPTASYGNILLTAVRPDPIVGNDQTG